MVTVARATQLRAGGPAAVRSGRRWPARVAVALGVLGVGYRLALLLAEVPPTNSDEATMGLAALHIAEGRELPVFFYGQYYMGALEAYLAAPLFVLAGASTLALRVPLLVLYGIFLVLMWRLTCRLYTPWLAAFTVGLLALGSERVLKGQLVALGGYPEMNPAGALLLLLAVNLGLGAVRRRRLAYAGWGFVAGLMVWDDWLLMPYVGMAGLLLFAVPGRRPGRGDVATLLSAAVLGAAPLLLHNLIAPLAQNSLSVFLSLNAGSGGTTLIQRFYGAVLVGLPMGIGLCPPAGCAPWQLWWGWTYPLLLGAAGVLAVRGLRTTARDARQLDPAAIDRDGPDGAAGDDRTARTRLIRQAGRLALVVAAALTVLAYLRSGSSATTPVASSRYLSCLLISTPAVLWPLWSVLAGRRSLPVRCAAAVPLVALVATMALATAVVVAEAPRMHRVADQRAQLVTELRRLGITRFYTEYWTCNVLIFASSANLRCAVIGDDLRPGQDRYAPYRDQVRAAPRPAYVLPADSPLTAAVRDRLRAADPGATVTAAAGYDIYQPTRHVGLPLR